MALGDDGLAVVPDPTAVHRRGMFARDHGHRVAGQVALRLHIHVVTRGECAARALDDDAPHRLVLVGFFESAAEVSEQGAAERVQALGAVQRDVGDVAAVSLAQLIDDVLIVCHFNSPYLVPQSFRFLTRLPVV